MHILQTKDPEDGYNKWPKHVGGYIVYDTINLHISISTCWLSLIMNHKDYSHITQIPSTPTGPYNVFNATFLDNVDSEISLAGHVPKSSQLDSDVV